jgi:hypothetical protein
MGRQRMFLCTVRRGATCQSNVRTERQLSAVLLRRPSSRSWPI